VYEFAILAFGGLITAKTVDLLRHLTKEMQKAGVLFLSAAAGVGYAFLLDFSLFAHWGVGVRADWIGTLATGLFMGGLAGAWHEGLGVMREWAHRYHGEATEIEARMHRAA
jgi:hypothetical protein